MLRALPRIAALAMLALPAVQAREPPAPYCMDAREVAEVWQADDHTMAVRLNDESRFRLHLADACPMPAHDDGEQPQLLAPGGWVCGSNEERLEIGGRQCAVSGIARIDARQFAELALDANRPGAADDAGMLDPVVVTERRRPGGRGFGGTTAYCFDARFVRGWSEAGGDLLVETSPRRSGGNRYYRVEMSQRCPQLSQGHGLRFTSAVGSSAICGHPGDRVVPTRTNLPADEDLRNLRPNLISAAGCPISRVYPVIDP